MRITYKGDYALKVVLDLALHNEKVVTAHELARRADIPIKFLEQILLDLKRGGFVQSRRGKVGGYLLARHPSEITIGEVIRFIDGPTDPISCVGKNYSGCSDIYRCVFRKIWQEVAQITSNLIDHVTFEDLARQIRRKEKAVSYSI